MDFDIGEVEKEFLHSSLSPGWAAQASHWEPWSAGSQPGGGSVWLEHVELHADVKKRDVSWICHEGVSIGWSVQSMAAQHD